MQDIDERIQVVVCNRLPGERMNPKMFFEIQDDDLEVKLARLPMTEKQDPKEIEKELEKCKGKLYLLSKGDCYKDYEEYIYENGEWILIGRLR